jgi:hypothetical protein
MNSNNCNIGKLNKIEVKDTGGNDDKSFSVFRLDKKHPPIRRKTSCIIIGNLLFMFKNTSDYAMTTPINQNNPTQPNATLRQKQAQI